MRCATCQEANDDSAPACFACGAPLGQRPLGPGSLIAERYELLQLLGQGGMGTVYRAHDRVLDEVVAIKTLRCDVAQDPELSRRFLSEIKLARKVRHENVCGIHEYGEDAGLRFIAMEYVDGEDLRRLLRRGGRLARDEAFDVALQLARGLEAIHEAGIIHRDLKTSNVMRDSRGTVRLMDFGIAKRFGTDVTLGPQLIGTPEYMSPEQARAGAVDYRSDLYALGIVVFEIFTGRVPFKGESLADTILQQLDEPPPLDRPFASAIPAPLKQVLARALQKDPVLRYQSAREMLAALRAASDEASEEATRPGGDNEPRPDETTPTVAWSDAPTLERPGAPGPIAATVLEPGPTRLGTPSLRTRLARVDAVNVRLWRRLATGALVAAAAAAIWLLLHGPSSGPIAPRGALPRPQQTPRAPSASASSTPRSQDRPEPLAPIRSPTAADAPRDPRRSANAMPAPPAISAGARPAALETPTPTPVPASVPAAATPTAVPPASTAPPAATQTPPAADLDAPIALPPSAVAPVWDPSNPRPIYPAAAAGSGVGAVVNLKLVVSRTGDVTSVEVLAGDEPFVSAATSVARDWRYSPARVDGQPRSVYLLVRIPFPAPPKPKSR
jgi:serine/threonine-protein kinase